MPLKTTFMFPAGHFWTLPNILTLSRGALLPVFWIVVSQQGSVAFTFTVVIIAYAIASDIADGIIARRSNQVSEWGKLLDPLVDKICTATLALYTYWHRDFPWWALATLLAKDILILFFGFGFLRNRKTIPTSNIWGKQSALFWGLALLAFVLRLPVWRMILLYAAVALTIPALFSYGLRILRSPANESISVRQSSMVNS